MTRLVINADDLGLSPTIDAAIRAAFESGTITSVSILANGPSSESALAWASSTGHPMGVHLALTEVEALTPTRLAPRGRFRPDVWDVLRAGAFDAAEVIAEWSAQVDRVRAAGVVVDHLDSHQHLHHLPSLRTLLTTVARDTGVKRVRGMARTGGRLQALRAWRFVAALRADGLITTDGFSSVNDYTPHSRWGTVELMCHPGNPAHARYAAEMDRLQLIHGERIAWGEV